MLWASLFSLGPHPPQHVITLDMYSLSLCVGEAVTGLYTSRHIFGRMTPQGCILATGILPECITTSRFSPDSVKYYFLFSIFIYSPYSPVPFPLVLQGALRLQGSLMPSVWCFLCVHVHTRWDQSPHYKKRLGNNNVLVFFPQDTGIKRAWICLSSIFLVNLEAESTLG